MARHLSVSEIRRSLYQAAGHQAPETSDKSTALLGRMFHDTFANLVTDDELVGFSAALAKADNDKDDWKRALIDHTYKRLVGPALTRHRAHLQTFSQETLSFWEAVKNGCTWLAEILWTLHTENTESSSRRRKRLGLKILFRPEEPLSYEFRDDDWSDSVIVSGIADLVIAFPKRPGWCLVEYKLGQACPEADLAQVALYHYILSSQEADDSGALALVGFKPECVEQLFDHQAVQEARQKLKALIGRLAGVVGTSATFVTPTSEAAAAAIESQTLSFDEGSVDYHKRAKQVLATFSEYGKKISLDGDPIPGPTFIRYPVTLGKGVKLSAAQKVAAELQHRLRLAAPPYVDVCEGRVVIDIQRPDRVTVDFSQITNQLKNTIGNIGTALVPIGVDLDGHLCQIPLSEPEDVHLLIAGTTGSGKSELLRSIIAGLMLTNSTEALRFVLIDPKRNAFNELRGSPYLRDGEDVIYPDETPASDVLQDLAEEMDERYRLFQKAGVDTRDDYVKTTGQMLPRIVCICDEYFDLINRGKKYRDAVEAQICRLGAKARAAAIHLIIATQHPSRKVIKGALDANLPARIGLKMSKSIESNMLLGSSGAENLLGHGDLLFKDIGEPKRLQAPLLSDEQRKEIFSKS